MRLRVDPLSLGTLIEIELMIELMIEAYRVVIKCRYTTSGDHSVPSISVALQKPGTGRTTPSA